jgi:hypothetical protein
MYRSNIDQKLHQVSGHHSEKAAVYSLNHVLGTEYEMEYTYYQEENRFGLSGKQVPENIINQLASGAYARKHDNRKQSKNVQEVYNDQYLLFQSDYREQLEKERQNSIITMCATWLAIIGLLGWWGFSAYQNHQSEALKNAQSSSSGSSNISTTPASTDLPPDELVNLPESFVVHPGGVAWIEAGTRPYSDCTIEVDYYSGPNHASGLYDKTADATGKVRWDWKIGTNTTPGNWPVYVTCTSTDGQSKSASTSIYVRY